MAGARGERRYLQRELAWRRMRGTGNGWGGCPCGVLRTKEDPKLTALYLMLSGRKLDDPYQGAHQTGTARACRSCGTVYALTQEQANQLPEKER